MESYIKDNQREKNKKEIFYENFNELREFELEELKLSEGENIIYKLKKMFNNLLNTL